MPRPTKTWQSVERRVAEFFGCRRQRLSGGSGRSDETSSDTTHEELYIEVKHRQKFFVQTLFDEVKRKAWKETSRGKVGKIPVVVLHEHGRRGFLVCVYSDDFLEIARTIQKDKDHFDWLETRGIKDDMGCYDG